MHAGSPAGAVQAHDNENEEDEKYNLFRIGPEREMWRAVRTVIYEQPNTEQDEHGE